MVSTPRCTERPLSQAAEKCVTSWPRRCSAAASSGRNRSAPRRTSGQQKAWVRAIRTAPQRTVAAMGRVSVIVPARDARATLPRTLAAIAAQDLAESFEVIVVDDGSRDDTARIANAA